MNGDNYDQRSDWRIIYKPNPTVVEKRELLALSK